MPADTASTIPAATVIRRAEGRFYIGMALAAGATALAGFAPAIFDPASRKAPLNWAVGVHGAVFSAWLALFLAQALLVFNRRIAVHRLLGCVGAGLAVIMLVSGYFTTIAMARRGFDLSGDLIGESGDPLMVMVFQLGDLLCFGILVAMGILFRHRPDAHKRLMLLATVGALMPAALSLISLDIRRSCEVFIRRLFLFRGRLYFSQVLFTTDLFVVKYTLFRYGVAWSFGCGVT